LREFEELIDVEPSWPMVVDQFAGSFTTAEILPADSAQARNTLLQLQVTVRSPLGAIALNCGGILVHDGFLRIFGGSNPAGPDGLPSMAEINGFPAEVDLAWTPSGGLIIAQDVLGGVFALNGIDPEAAGRPGQPGEVTYFSPRSLEWDAMGLGHSAWLSAIVCGGLAELYEGLLWPGWRDEVGPVGPRGGLSFYPFLWSAEAQDDLAGTTRQPVPMDQLLSLHADTCRQMGLADPGFLGRYSTTALA
jgi:hypothetical protein